MLLHFPPMKEVNISVKIQIQLAENINSCIGLCYSKMLLLHIGSTSKLCYQRTSEEATGTKQIGFLISTFAVQDSSVISRLIAITTTYLCYRYPSNLQ